MKSYKEAYMVFDKDQGDDFVLISTFGTVSPHRPQPAHPVRGRAP